MRVRYTPRAFADREQIFDYLAQRSPSGARAGLALLDPHGDLAQAVLAHVPRHRTNDLVYIDYSGLGAAPATFVAKKRSTASTRLSATFSRQASDMSSLTSSLLDK